MGCWNGTCALTKLPIMAGEPVYTFVLVQEYPLDPSLCYHTDFWVPLPLFFEGVYDDYGSVENCVGASIDLILKSLQKNLVEKEAGDNQYHDFAVTRAEMDNLEFFFSATKDNLLYVKNHVNFHGEIGEKSLIKPIMIRKEVLDAIINDYTYQTSSWDRDTNEVTYNTMNFKMLYDDAMEHMMAVRYKLLENKDDPTKNIMLRFSFDDAFYVKGLVSGKTDPVGDIFCSLYRGYKQENRSFMDISGYIFESLESETFDLINHLTFQLCVSIWLNNFMSAGRNMWCPPSGAGSQDQETDVQVFLANQTIISAEAIKSRYDEEDEEGDDEF